MRVIAVIFTILWAGFWGFVGIRSLNDTVDQIKKDKIFIQEEIKPSVDFIKNFKRTFKRLPTNREFFSWECEYYKDYSVDLAPQADSLISGFGSVSYIRNKLQILSGDQHKFKNADWTKDFAISVWRGEWMEYYFSWNDHYDTNNYSWNDGYISLLLFCVLALLPLLLWWPFYSTYVT